MKHMRIAGDSSTGFISAAATTMTDARCAGNFFAPVQRRTSK